MLPILGLVAYEEWRNKPQKTSVPPCSPRLRVRIFKELFSIEKAEKKGHGD
jgi:hypothetical protein